MCSVSLIKCILLFPAQLKSASKGPGTQLADTFPAYDHIEARKWGLRLEMALGLGFESTESSRAASLVRMILRDFVCNRTLWMLLSSSDLWSPNLGYGVNVGSVIAGPPVDVSPSPRAGKM